MQVPHDPRLLPAKIGPSTRICHDRPKLHWITSSQSLDNVPICDERPIVSVQESRSEPAIYLDQHQGSIHIGTGSSHDRNGKST
jgi:hypothetical protein